MPYCLARYPDNAIAPASGCYFCTLEAGHNGAHHNPLVPQADPARWYILTHEQRNEIFAEAIKEDQRRAKNRQAAQASPDVHFNAAK